MRLIVFLSFFFVSISVFSQEKKGKPVAADWEQTFYPSYFSKYYYGYYYGYGASELAIEFGHKGWNIDLISWIKDQYGAGIGYASGYKGENGLSFIFSYAVQPSLQARVAPVVRFIPATLEEDKKVSLGFDIDVVYFHFKNFGFKAGYGSTTGFSLGTSIRVNNIIFER